MGIPPGTREKIELSHSRALSLPCCAGGLVPSWPRWAERSSGRRQALRVWVCGCAAAGTSTSPLYRMALGLPFPTLRSLASVCPHRGGAGHQPLCVLVSPELFLRLFINCTVGDPSGLGRAAVILTTGVLPTARKGRSRPEVRLGLCRRLPAEAFGPSSCCREEGGMPDPHRPPQATRGHPSPRAVA